MNLFAVFLCITAGTMTGLFFTKRSAGRARYFAGLVELIDGLKRNLMFRKDKLAVFLDDVKPDDKLLGKHIDKFRLYVMGQVAVEDGKNLLDKGFLKEVELAAVQKFFMGLGAGDSATELEALQSHKDYFAGIYAKHKVSFERMGTAYTKLGFLAGLAAGILLL